MTDTSSARIVPAGPGTPGRPVLLVTRPQPQADQWVDALAAAGWPARALPLLRIEPCGQASVLQAVQEGLRPGDLLMFVSPNAALAYFEALEPAHRHWPSGVLAAATGPGTVMALARSGVPAAAIVAPAADAPQFDSEALWALLSQQPWQGRRAWVVRGEGGRDWLSRRLTAAGAQVQALTSYRRLGPDWTTQAVALRDAAQARPLDHAWLFSSSECIQHLCDGTEPGSWQSSCALATHPRIAETAQAAGFGRVVQTRPELAEVLDTLHRLLPVASPQGSLP